MKELVVVSGKGGTGKTSVVASFAALADDAVFADCDVDAADLHLILDPKNSAGEDFVGGVVASIDESKCVSCGRCAEACRFDAVSRADSSDGGPVYRVDPMSCEGCGVCELVCPAEAVVFADQVSGRWFVSDSRFGPFVHARLGIAEENSGKLVTLVRREAKRVAEESGAGLVVIDGSPGIGCPVIASLTAADSALIVTEPTLSGLHDLMRIAELAERLSVPFVVCINKWDINPGTSDDIEEWARARGSEVAGRIPYDDSVTKAQVEGKAVVEYADGPAADAIRLLWDRVSVWRQSD